MSGKCISINTLTNIPKEIFPWGYSLAHRITIIYRSRSLPDNDALDSARDGGEDFVGDGAKDIGKFRDLGVFSEDGDGVAHF